MAKRTFDDFDEYADDYRGIHTDNVKISGAGSFYFAEHKVLQVVRSETGNSVLRLLDIGCGDGATELFFHKHMPGWKLNAIDISAKSIARANEKQVPGAEFSLYDGEHIPFGDGSFDVLFMAAVLHHISFSLHAGLMKEMYRVLKPGGRLYLFEHNPYNPVTRHVVNTCVFDRDAKLLYPNYCRKLLKSVSFTEVKGKYLLFFPRKGILSNLIKWEENLGWLPLGGQYMFRAVK